ncbi:hypothetical protein CROQUDRAFT_696290 [Cronartium quercuum f. sp. fusiforme G11]|uniref:Uncharacterized protein n=1 Tax=Cronartium quercuum f. sp. fusiforme G11 TaxID=708437 RepID=A0A9P6N9A1_9BASI|nr:hypothetical protein CROQUDRAFT_696290 [Cronartium quercuum f. sp. fusiforme G11]
MVEKGSVERLPVMNEYPKPYSVLVKDDAQIHHGDLIEQICHEAGVLCAFLPAY